MSSLPFDWYVRLFVETQMNFFLVQSFPVPAGIDSRIGQRCIEISAKLMGQNPKLNTWAIAASGDHVGGEIAIDDALDLEAELDAVVAHLYGLSKSQLQYIQTNFRRGWDSSDIGFVNRFERMMSHYDAWAAKS
jgi:hypothetical protein